MTRHPNQQKGPATYIPRTSNHSTFGHTDASTAREDAAKLDALRAKRPLKPPGKQAVKRDWRLHVDLHGIQTCGECGRSIMPTTDFMRDQVSGHMNRHVECHERAEAKGAG